MFKPTRTQIQKYLPHILIGVLLIIAIIVWQGFFKKEKVFFPSVVFTPQIIEIDFEILENPFLDDLQEFGKIELPEGEIETGRNNPFISY